MKSKYQPIRNQTINPRLSEEDLANSYLYKYESNAYHQINREQTKNTLKDITDKYGFVWDEMGRLSKSKGISEKTAPQLHIRGTQDTRNKSTNKSTNKQNRQVHYQNEILQPSSYLKSQINNINQRINLIVNKYKPQTQEPQVEVHYQQNNFKEDFCRCHQKNRLLTEQETIESPYFQRESLQNVTINRSKSANYLPRPKTRVSEDVCEKSEYSPNKLLNRQRKIQQNYRDASPETKMIDTQIDRINQRIKQCEREKEKLSIDFKKYEVRGKSKTPEKSRIAQQQPKTVSKKLERQEFSTPISNISKDESKAYLREKAEGRTYQKENEEGRAYHQKQKEKEKQSSVIIYEDRSDQLQLVLPKKINVSTKKQACFRKADNKGIISKFCRQIELDEEFRNAKLWFENNEDPHKWGIIADKLALEGKEMKYRELVDKFSCMPQQHNPFFSVKNSYESYASLLSVYKEDQRHWKQQIENKITPEQLELEEFTAEELDVEEKGGVRVEDFVRYINMRTKNFYRTRDLLLIFQRFAGKEKKQVHFSRVLSTLVP